jgi:hypothetical protein
MKRFRYNRIQLLLDIFGLVGVALTILFYIKGHTVRLQNEELYNLWVAFATGIITLWIGVRIIEHLIRKHEKTSSNRIRAVRNMRFLMNRFRDHVEYPRRGDLDQLRFELDWAKKMFSNHRRVFQRDEINDVSSFYAKFEQALPRFIDLLQAKDDSNLPFDSAASEATRADSRRKYANLQEELWSFMRQVDEARITAEKNILKETEEEWL